MTSLPSPRELRASLPLSSSQSAFIASSRKTAIDLLLRKDPRLLIVLGPCSIHDTKSALEYAERVYELSKKVKDFAFLVMRAYVEKPRTQAGWKGMLYDPHLDGSYAIGEGLELSRRLLIALAEKKVPVATEFVDPIASPYLDDLITWGFIGARTSASQPHRQLASSLPFPIGFKNGVDGNIEQAIHAQVAASAPHVFMQVDLEGKLAAKKSEGNPFGHVVLRGSLSGINYDPLSIARILKKISLFGIKPRILVDCAHDNSQKLPEKQKEAFCSVLKQIAQGTPGIFGFMLESHLQGGNQSLSEEGASSLKYAVSITDPCLDWASTAELILEAGRIRSGAHAGAEAGA